MADERGARQHAVDLRWGVAWLLLAVFIIAGSAGRWAPGPPIWAPLMVKARDVAQNVAVYVPFGVFGIATFRRVDARAVARVVGIAALFSLANESLQLYTINRVASLTDVVSAVVGTSMGAAGMRRWRLR